jgi:hypothetical protein
MRLKLLVVKPALEWFGHDGRQGRATAGADPQRAAIDGFGRSIKTAAP